MSFDTDGIMRKVKEVAHEKVLAVLHEAKREMGAEGHAIRINEKSSVVGAGDKTDIAGVTFPSEEVKGKFLAIVNRKLR